VLPQILKEHLSIGGTTAPVGSSHNSLQLGYGCTLGKRDLGAAKIGPTIKVYSVSLKISS